MDMKSASIVALRDNMALKAGEKVLIVTDDALLPIGQSLYETAKELGAEASLIVSQPRDHHGQEPNEMVAAAMMKADVILLPTSTSMSHTAARVQSCKNGARLGSMPTITQEMFSTGAMTADYSEVERLTRAVTERLTKAKHAKVVKDGHVLEMSLAGRDGVPSTGIYRNAGESGNLPSGEAFIAPVEGSANGTMLADGSAPGFGILTDPLIFTVKDGLLTDMQGDPDGKLAILMQNEQNRNLAELGVGTNVSAILRGNVLEDEKLYGSVHIAFGSNKSFGGNVAADCHMDLIIQRPQLFLDGELVMENGKIML